MSKDPVGGSSMRACSSSDMVHFQNGHHYVHCNSNGVSFRFSHIHDDLRQTFEWKDVYLRKKLFGIRRQSLTPCMQVDPRMCGWDQYYQCSFDIAVIRC